MTERWHVLVTVEGEELEEALADGWEPFAAWLNVGHWFALRKLVTQGFCLSTEDGSSFCSLVVGHQGPCYRSIYRRSPRCPARYASSDVRCVLILGHDGAHVTGNQSWGEL